MSISWLLFKKSGRQSLGRLSLTVAAIGLGTLILLSFVSGLNGMTNGAGRELWTTVSYDPNSANIPPAVRDVAKQAQKPINGVAPLKIGTIQGKIGNTFRWREQDISQTILHATGKNSPEFKNLKTPANGEYYLSPGLDKIAREHPEEKIGDRFGNKYLGVIPAEYVKSPDSLEVVRAAQDDELVAWVEQADMKFAADVYDTSVVEKLKTSFGPFEMVIFGMGGSILLVPIIMFVAVSTQLGSTQREQRYAALRLIGATRSQINRILLLESFVASALGIVLGTLVFWLAHPAMFSDFEFAGQRFWMDDVFPTLTQYIIIIVLTIVLSLFASWRAMRKVRTSPLGVARREKLDKKPSAWRTLPLAVGLAMFVWLKTEAGSKWIKGDGPNDAMPMLFMMAAILLLMFGLLLAGSWLTAALSKLFARFTKNATVLLASRRIAAHSRKVFRSVGGVVLALFAGSFYLAAVSGIGNLELASINNNGYSQLKPNTALLMSADFSEELEGKLSQQSFIKSTAKVYDGKGGETYIPCRQLATYTKHSCSGDDNYAKINFNNAVVKSVETVKADQLPAEKTDSYLVLHDGAARNIDLLRSLAIANTPAVTQVYVADGSSAQKPKLSPIITTFSSLTYVGIGVTLFVAIASLIVSTIGGLLERRRSLFTLRLGGMTLGQMKRVVLIESLIPLISTSILAAASGIWVATIFLETFSSSVRVSLSAAYFAIVIGALCAAIIGIYLVLPMIKRITSLEENQTE